MTPFWTVLLGNLTVLSGNLLSGDLLPGDLLPGDPKDVAISVTNLSTEQFIAMLIESSLSTDAASVCVCTSLRYGYAC